MKLEGTAIVTGASRGIGTFIASTLASRKVDLVLAARDEDGLDKVRKDCEALGCKAIAVPTDVADPRALDALVDAAEAAFGHVDLLVNNAGIELVRPYASLSVDEIGRSLDVNLRAPMLLTRRVLPGMLERDRGHVVNIASVAGLTGSAMAETYCGTKHGLVGFTRSLRVSLQAQGTNVSASAICPGFVDDVGMYVQMRKEGGDPPSFLLGSTSPQSVADAVVRAVERDLADVVVNRMPLRPTLIWQTLFPRVYERVGLMLGLHGVFASTAAKRVSG